MLLTVLNTNKHSLLLAIKVTLLCVIKQLTIITKLNTDYLNIHELFGMEGERYTSNATL